MDYKIISGTDRRMNWTVRLTGIAHGTRTVGPVTAVGRPLPPPLATARIHAVETPSVLG